MLKKFASLLIEISLFISVCLIIVSNDLKQPKMSLSTKEYNLRHAVNKNPQRQGSVMQPDMYWLYCYRSEVDYFPITA